MRSVRLAMRSQPLISFGGIAMKLLYTRQLVNGEYGAGGVVNDIVANPAG